MLASTSIFTKARAQGWPCEVRNEPEIIENTMKISVGEINASARNYSRKYQTAVSLNDYQGKLS